MVVKTFPSVKIAEVPDNFIIKGFPFSVNSDLKVNGRISRLSNKQRNAAFRFGFAAQPEDGISHRMDFLSNGKREINFIFFWK